MLRMASTLRDQTVTFRFSEEDRRMLRELADAEGISASDVVRQQIRRLHRAVFGAPKPTKKGSKK